MTRAASADGALSSRSGRVLVLASLLGNAGFGLYQAGAAVYYVRVVGLTPTEVGAGLSVAGLAGLLLGIPLGHWADRRGARGVAMAMAAAKSAAMLGLAWVDTAGQYVAAVVLLGVADAGWNVANEAVIAATTSGADRVRISAYLRSAANVGMTVGSLGAGLALAADTRPAYQVLFWGYLASSLAVAALYLRLPPTLPGPATSRGLRAVRDLPYLAVAQVSCLTLLSDTVLAVGLPLWIVAHTDVPRSLAAWLIALNTLLVVALQVRAVRGTETVPGAVRVQRWAFAALVAMCLLAGAAGSLPASLPAAPAGALLVGATLALTAGEMWGQGSRWALRFTFAPAEAQGQYGAAFRLGQLLPRVGGPVLVTALTSHWLFGGWVVLAAIFAAALTLNGPVVAWAERTRP